MAEDRLLRQSLNALEDVFYIFDERGELIFWNDQLNDLFGLSDDELEGMTPTEFFLDADRPAVERAIATVYETGGTVVEARARTTAGTRLFELTGRILTDADGSVVGFAGVGRDVTDRREQSVQLATQNSRLNEFATILTHDLRNPLAVAYANLELYRSDGDPERLDQLSAALDRMDRIVDDVLVMTRDGKRVTDTQSVGLATVVREAWTSVVTGDAHLEVDTSMEVTADVSRLRRLFENLFRNAVEHAGSTVTVTVTGTTAGFAVEDDGPGIPEADRERVFDPGVSVKSEGTGFGLSIVETIAEAHGWLVAVTESDAGGARFEFTLVPGDDGDVNLEIE